MRGGSVTVWQSRFEGNVAAGHEGGALRATGGVIELLDSSFISNEAARGGALHASGENTRVDAQRSRFALNRAALHGGALAVDRASVLLANATALVSNKAPVGASIHVASGVLAYSLPAPLGSWVASSFRCRWYRSPCPPADSDCDPAAQPLLPTQPCPLLAQRPALDGLLVAFLPLGGLDEDFPYAALQLPRPPPPPRAHTLSMTSYSPPPCHLHPGTLAQPASTVRLSKSRRRRAARASAPQATAACLAPSRRSRASPAATAPSAARSPPRVQWAPSRSLRGSALSRSAAVAARATGARRGGAWLAARTRTARWRAPRTRANADSARQIRIRPSRRPHAATIASATPPL